LIESEAELSFISWLIAMPMMPAAFAMILMRILRQLSWLSAFTPPLAISAFFRDLASFHARLTLLLADIAISATATPFHNTLSCADYLLPQSTSQPQATRHTATTISLILPLHYWPAIYTLIFSLATFSG
jgi:hypothetical protein